MSSLPLSNFNQEEWRAVVNFDGLYEISSLGRIRSLPRLEKCGDRTRTRAGRIVKTSLKDYAKVTLHKEGKRAYFLVHRLVAQAFLEVSSQNVEVNHKDGNKQNNCSQNLEWVTKSENNLHAYALGLSDAPKGEAHSQAKLTEAKILYIRSMKGLKSGRKLAAQLGVSRRAVDRVLSGDAWKHVKVS